MAVQTNAYGILSDEQGFGIGTVVADIRLQNQVLEDIRHTVSAIHQLLRHPHSQVNSIINSSPAVTPSVINSSPAITPSVINSILAVTPTVINSIPAVTPTVINSIPAVTPNPLRDYPRPRERDTSGRFISNRTAAPVVRRERSANGRFTSGDTDTDNNTFLSRLIDGVRQGYVEAQNDLTDIDPAVAAAQEIAAPLGRTYDVLLGGGRSETVWYKRIWRELRTQSGFHRAELRTLNDIENRPMAVSAGDSGLLGLIKTLPAVIGSLLKATIKKVPFVAAGLGAVSSLLGINETENDPTLSRAEKDAQNGRNVGGVTGSIAGMMAGGRLGAALGSFAGPIGTGVGGLLGAGAGYLAGDELGKIWGEHVGTYFNEMRNSDLAAYMKQAWDTDMQFLRDVISTLQNAVNAVTGWIDNVTGKVKELAAPVIENVKENAAWINNAVKDSTGFDLSKVADVVKRGADTVKSGAGRVWDNVKIAGSSLAGKTSEIASKAGDSSLVRGFKATTSKDDFIKQIYPAAKRSADATGIPVDAVIGQAALESNWGRNAPEGSNNLFGIKAGANWQGKTVDTTTHEVINGKRVKIKAPFRAYDSLDDSIADHSKFLNNKRYQAAKNAQNAEEYFTALKAGGYATDPNYVRSGTAVASNVHSRIEALGLNKTMMPKAASNKASVASIPTAKVPALPAMVKAPEQPQIVEKINTNRESDKQTTVQNSTPLASPLVSDLRIAHIARGGIGLL